MSNRIGRRFASQTVDIAISTATAANAIDFTDMSGAIIKMPSAWTAASIGFKVAETESGDKLPLYDDDGALVQIDSPAVDQAYSVPVEVFAAGWVWLWSQDGSGNDTNQLAARSLIVMKKG